MSEWPTSTDLRHALSEAGIPVPSASRLESALALAVEAFQDATGYYPFAAAEDPTAEATPLYGPAGSLVSILPFGTGILPSPAPAVTLEGEALTLATDYVLCPQDAARRGTPYTYLKLLGRRIGDGATLSISGVCGYCAFDAVPEMARQSVLSYAALDIAAPSIQAGTATRVLSQADEGDVRYQWGTSIEERQSAVRAWQASWNAGVSRYRRNSVV